MNAKIKKYAPVFLFAGFWALIVIHLCGNYPSESSNAAIHNLRMIDDLMKSNGNVFVNGGGGGTSRQDKRN
jgi:hypothetical protein